MQNLRLIRAVRGDCWSLEVLLNRVSTGDREVRDDILRCRTSVAIVNSVCLVLKRRLFLEGQCSCILVFRDLRFGI